MSWFDLSALFPPRWDWVQVEVTTRCTATCSYCPRTLYRDLWQDRDLPVELFQKLAPALRQARLVYLQGWGEPLLHPDFFTLAAAAKEAGSQVGFTTNGMLLDREKIATVVAMGIEVVAFSLAGGDKSNDVIREGTRWERVRRAVLDLQEAKAAAGVERPRVHIAYMLLRSYLAELETLPTLLAGWGIDQVVISTLELAGNQALAAETLPRTAREFYVIQARLEALKKRLAEAGLSMVYRLRRPAPGPSLCPENVERALVVAADGAVTPCVFRSLDLPGAEEWNDAGPRPLTRLVFGNIREQTLPVIWKAPRSRQFRQAWRKPGPPAECRGCRRIASPLSDPD